MLLIFIFLLQSDHRPDQLPLLLGMHERLVQWTLRDFSPAMPNGIFQTVNNSGADVTAKWDFDHCDIAPS